MFVNVPVAVQETLTRLAVKNSDNWLLVMRKTLVLQVKNVYKIHTVEIMFVFADKVTSEIQPAKNVEILTNVKNKIDQLAVSMLFAKIYQEATSANVHLASMAIHSTLVMNATASNANVNRHTN
jgi:hypothetical protein